MPAKDDNIVPVPSLDEVHTQTVHKLEAEPPKDDTPPLEDKPKDENKPADPVEPPKEDAKTDNAPAPEPPKEEPKSEPKVELPPEPVLDTDITKPGDGKIAIKNSDGDMMYFNNTDEIPDDFEPASYKEFFVFSSKMAKKEIADEQLAKERELAEQTAKNQAEIDAVTSSWDRDIDVLTKGGVLPEDPKERETEIGDTYAYIAKKISDGVIVDSFAEAHKAMKYDQLKGAEKIVADAKGKEVKERGSKVMGSSGASASSTAGKPREGLPAGTTLDQVHAKFSGLV